MADGGEATQAGSPLTGAVAWTLAAVVFGAGLVQALSGPLSAWSIPEQWPRAEALPQPAFLAVLFVGFALQSLGVVLARRSPLAGLALTFAVYAALVFGLDTPTWVAAGNLAVAVAMFFVAERGSVARIVIAMLATVVALCGVNGAWAVWRENASADEMASWLLRIGVSFIPLVIAGGVSGGLAGRQSRRVAAARREADAARREQELRVAQAKEDERERIAQELHDVAAQHVTVQLSLAEAVGDVVEADPTTAAQLVAALRAEGRFAVASLYGALGELRSPDGHAPRPTPDALQIADLVDQRRAQGMDVHLLVLGDLAALPAVVSVTAYRTVQEALTNAAKHAPGAPVSVRVVADVERLKVTVENGPPTRPDTSDAEAIGLGWGLPGLRKRLALLDGELRAETIPDGGWRTVAELPLTTPSPARPAAQ